MSVELRPNFSSVEGNQQIITDLGNGMSLFLTTIDGVGALGLTYNDYADQLVVTGISFGGGQTIVATVAYFAETTPEFAAGLYLFYNGNNPTIIEQANLSEGRIVESTVWPIFSSRFSTGGWSAVVPGPNQICVGAG